MPPGGAGADPGSLSGITARTAAHGFPAGAAETVFSSCHFTGQANSGAWCRQTS